MKVLCFGVARDIVGSSTLEIKEALHDVKSLKAFLEGRFPEFGNLKSYMVAVDEEYAEDELPINSAQTIAIIPPVSGG